LNGSDLVSFPPNFEPVAKLDDDELKLQIMKQKRRKFTEEYKLKVILEALK
jgi:hypothetical protein